MTLNKRWLHILPVAIFLAAIAPLAITPVLPFIDFYNHVARFYVLAHVGSSPLLQRYYQARWTLLPDVGVDLLATPILIIMPPLVAAKVIAVGILANLYFGVLYFHRVITGRSSTLIAILLAPLLYSYILNWGFENFLLGLGMAFWAAGWWTQHRSSVLVAVPISCVFALAIFFCHGVAFLLYGILVGSLEIGSYLAAENRKLIPLIHALGILALQAVFPVIFFLAWKYGYAAGGAVPTLHLASIPLSTRLVRGVLYHLITIVRVEEGPAFWFDLGTLIIQLGVIAILFHNGILKFERPVRFVAIAVAIMAAVPLPTLFGVGYIADRIPLFAALTLIGTMHVRPGQWTKTDLILAGVILAVAFARLGAVAASWRPYNQAYREFQFIAAKIPRGSMTTGISIGAGHHETGIPRCEMYGPLLIAQYGQVGPLFADEKQQPLRLIGPLAPKTNSAVPEHTSYNQQLSHLLSSGFDDVLVCNIQLLKKPIPKALKVIAQTSHFALLEGK